MKKYLLTLKTEIGHPHHYRFIGESEAKRIMKNPEKHSSNGDVIAVYETWRIYLGYNDKGKIEKADRL